MPRELPIQIVPEAIGQVVSFQYPSICIVLKINAIEPKLEGSLVAMDGKLPIVDSHLLHSVDVGTLIKYEILSRKDLPLLIGYRVTTPLLAELIKGGMNG